MQYKQLVQIPVGPVPDVEFGSKDYRYTAEITNTKRDGSVLVLTVYSRNTCRRDVYSAQKKSPQFAFRHFFTPTAYVTQLHDEKRADGGIGCYIHSWRRADVRPVTADDDNIITDYCNANGIEILKPYTDWEGDSVGLLYRAIVPAEEKLRKSKLAAKHKRETDVIDNRMKLVNAQLPQGFDQWLEDFVFEGSRYFFYSYARRKEQAGYCSYCKHTFSAAVKHGDMVDCPRCHSTLTASALGKTTKYGIGATAQVVIMEPHAEENILILRGFNVQHEINGHQHGAHGVKVALRTYENKRTFHDLQSIAPAPDERGSSEYIWADYKQTHTMRWCNNDFRNFSWPDGWIYPGTLLDVVAASGAVANKNIDYCKIAEASPFIAALFFRTVEKYPCLENLAKLGFTHLAREVVNVAQKKYEYYSADGDVKSLNLSATSVKDMLGVDRVTAEHLRAINATAKQVVFYKRFCCGLHWDLASEMMALFSENAHALANLLDYTVITPQRAVNYVKKQMGVCRTDNNNVITQWRDYLSMCKQARIALDSDLLMYPKNIIKEHDRVSELISLRKNAAANKRLAARAKKLSVFEYADKNFIIRPLRTFYEFEKESEVLRHCVKTYAERCSKGETNIFGIRTVQNPDAPYFTLELNDKGVVRQNHGLRNCAPPKDVERFVAKWLDECVKKNLPKYTKSIENKKAAKQPAKIGA